MKRGSLLLVDDDPYLVDSMAQWLRDQGHRVDTALNVREAAAAVDRQAYDVVLTDIRLGEGDGFHVLEHCHRHSPESAVILMTGYGTVESAVEGIRAGAFDFLTKPLIDEELELSIQRALKPAKWSRRTRTSRPSRSPLRHREHRGTIPPCSRFST